MQSIQPEVKYYPSSGGYPFSEAVRVGHMLYLAGQIGTDASGKVVPGGISPETTQTMENIKAVLEKCGSSLDNVIDVTVALADISEWPAMNAVYQKYFLKHFPARNAFAASGLALSARLEITCKAIVRKQANPRPPDSAATKPQ